jgi:glycosyltransferase involved in cell wall biosynthesis
VTVTQPRAAIVHDYFVQDGGAERVAVELARLLPSAEVYTTFFDEERFGDRIDPARVHTWPLAGHFDEQRFRSLLPLYPAYFSALDMRGFELVVSSSSAFAKAARTSRRARHIAFIHSPMRFAWHFDTYARGTSFGLPARVAGRVLAAPLRTWDRRTSRGPDLLVANSRTVRERIRASWRRDAEVVYPPVDVHELRVSTSDDGFLLVAARLLGYRRIDLALEAASATGRRIVVVGEGPERRVLERRFGASAEFLGHIPREQLLELFESCHAYVVPGEEDFGIAPVEAMAAGKPVVAFNRGGAAETVVDGVTGVLFNDATAAGLADALERLDALALDPDRIRQRALRFDVGAFREAMGALIERYSWR